MKILIEPLESTVIQMALTSFIEDCKEGIEMIGFTKAAKVELAKMLTSAISAKEKIVLVSGHEVKLEAMTEEDEKIFLTTQK